MNSYKYSHFSSKKQTWATGLSMRFFHFAGIKEHEFSNNLFPFTWWSNWMNLKVFLFSFLKYRIPCKGCIMSIKFHFWMHLHCLTYHFWDKKFTPVDVLQFWKILLLILTHSCDLPLLHSSASKFIFSPINNKFLFRWNTFRVRLREFLMNAKVLWHTYCKSWCLTSCIFPS